MHDNEIEGLMQEERERIRQAEKAPKSTITQNSLWSYKGVTYQVNSLMECNLSQDPETGEWHPTVRYTNFPQTGLVFYRSYTEWLRKFRLEKV